MSVDITKLSDADLAYMEGFVSKCAELGLDPEAELAKLAACGGKKKAKKPALKKKAEGCCAEPGTDTACESGDKETKAKPESKKDNGAKSKLFGGRAAPLFKKKAQDMLGMAPAPEEKGTTKRVIGGVGKGGAVGAALGGAAGGAIVGGATVAGGGMPRSKGELIQLLKLMAAGVVGGAIPGAAAGGFTGGVMRAVE